MSMGNFNLYTKKRLGFLGPINVNQIQYLDMMGKLIYFLKLLLLPYPEPHRHIVKETKH